jgi:hypothetical protein
MKKDCFPAKAGTQTLLICWAPAFAGERVAHG